MELWLGRNWLPLLERPLEEEDFRARPAAGEYPWQTPVLASPVEPQYTTMSCLSVARCQRW